MNTPYTSFSSLKELLPSSEKDGFSNIITFLIVKTDGVGCKKNFKVGSLTNN